jgi:hypothetical protein
VAAYRESLVAALSQEGRMALVGNTRACIRRRLREAIITGRLVDLVTRADGPRGPRRHLEGAEVLCPVVLEGCHMPGLHAAQLRTSAISTR